MSGLQEFVRRAWISSLYFCDSIGIGIEEYICHKRENVREYNRHMQSLQDDLAALQRRREILRERYRNAIETGSKY